MAVAFRAQTDHPVVVPLEVEAQVHARVVGCHSALRHGRVVLEDDAIARHLALLHARLPDEQPELIEREARFRANGERA